MHSDHEAAREKRHRVGALQNLSEVRGTVANAPASWSAAALRRFRCERALEICAVHGEQISPRASTAHVLRERASESRFAGLPAEPFRLARQPGIPLSTLMAQPSTFSRDELVLSEAGSPDIIL